MSNITSYSRGGQYVYQEWKHFENVSGASGTSGASGVGTSSNESGASGASAISSGASGAVYEYGGVQNLDAEQIIELFREGRLVKAEMEKWLSANRTLVTDLSFTETKDLITYKFSHKGKEYTVSCTPEASKSQTDNKTQRIYSKGQIESYKSRYKLTNEDVAKYFILASFDGVSEFYAMNPESGLTDPSQIQKAKEEELAKKAEQAETEEAKYADGAYEKPKAETESNIEEDAKAVRMSATVKSEVKVSLDTLVKNALAKQNLLKVNFDEFENNLGRTVAIGMDDNGEVSYYDYDTVKQEFVKRVPQEMVNIILGKNEYNGTGTSFNITDVVRTNNVKLDQATAMENYKHAKADEQGLTYKGDGKAVDTDGDTWIWNDSSRKFEANKGGSEPGADDAGSPGFEKVSQRRVAAIMPNPIETALLKQNLLKVNFDEFENNLGRTVAIGMDDNGEVSYYDYDTVKQEFVKRIAKEMVNIILGKNEYNGTGTSFNITDVVRTNNVKLDQATALENYKHAKADEQGLTYKGDGKAVDKDGDTWTWNNSSRKFEANKGGSEPGADDIKPPSFDSYKKSEKRKINDNINLDTKAVYNNTSNESVAPTILPPQQPTIEVMVQGTIPDSLLEKYHSAEENFSKGNLSLKEALKEVGGWLNGKPEVVDGVFVAHYQVGNYFGTFRCDADNVKQDVYLTKEE